MTPIKTSSSLLAPPPTSLLASASLFLDIDGTLLDIVDDPHDVVADELLRSMLLRVADALDGRVAIISGRSLAQIETIFGPVARLVALSGSHGSEHRWRGIEAHPIRPDALDVASAELRKRFERTAGVLVEEKSFGVAVHFRQAPDAEQEAHAIARRLAERYDLSLQEGKMMVELHVGNGNKGAAIRRLMSRPPMVGTRPIFIGDDLTDEPGFAVAKELGGAGILVGDRDDTAARYRIASPQAVRTWLEAFAA